MLVSTSIMYRMKNSTAYGIIIIALLSKNFARIYAPRKTKLASKIPPVIYAGHEWNLRSSSTGITAKTTAGIIIANSNIYLSVKYSLINYQ